MTDLQIKQIDRDIWFQVLTAGGHDTEATAYARRNIDSGMYDDLPAIRAIALSRQAAQERDAGIAKSRERADDFNQPYIEGWNEACGEIATAIRSQGHE